MENKKDYSSIESFRMKNIKGFVDSDMIELKPITLFVGENSSGKSSTLRFPAALAQTFVSESENPIHFFGRYVDYGVFNEIVHQQGSKESALSITFEISVKMPFDTVAAGFSSSAVKEKSATAEVTIAKENEVSPLYVSRFVLKIGQLLLFKLDYSENKDGKYTLTQYKNNNEAGVIKNVAVGFDHFLPYFKADEAVEELMLYRIEREKMLMEEYADRQKYLQEKLNWDREKEKKLRNKVIYMAEEMEHISNLDRYFEQKKSETDEEDCRLAKEIDDLQKELAELPYEREAAMKTLQSPSFDYRGAANDFRQRCRAAMEQVFYIGPFRSGPSRTYRDPEFRVEYVGAAGENVSNFLVSAFHANHTFLEKVSDELEALLGYSLRVKGIGNGLFQLKVYDGHTESNLMDSGYGLSMVLPIIAQTMYGAISPKNRDEEGKAPYMTIIEQPELHLHPAAQARLAKFFADCATKAPDNKIVIETHSEHLIRKLQVLVADKNCRLSSDMIKIYYVKKDLDGEAYVMDMRMTESGAFEDRWPTGFFDSGYQLSMELLAAKSSF